MAEGEVRVVFKSEDRMTDGVKKAKSGLADLGKAVGIASLSFAGLGMAASKAWEFLKQGAEVSRLSTAAATMAGSFGQSMNQIVSAMRSASRETVDDLTLMGAAAKALQLGVAKTPEDFEKLTTAAVALGRAMGRGPADAINDITTGIGRMSPLILDNLGILTRGGAVFDDYAADLGKTADQLTDTEKKQALLNVTLESAAPLLDNAGMLALDAASRFEIVDAKIKNLIDSFKMLAGDTVYQNIITTERLNDEMERLGETIFSPSSPNNVGLLEWRKRWWDLYDAINQSVVGIQTVARRTGDDLIPAASRAGGAAEDMAWQFGMVKGSINGVSEEVRKLGENRLLELAATELAAGNTSLADKYMAEYHALRKLNAEIQKNLSLLQYQLSPDERRQVSESSLRDELKDMR